MGQFKIFVKPTSGGDKITVEVGDSMTISDLKEAIATAASIPSAEQRVIYKGQVLKNERTVESYGAARPGPRLVSGHICTVLQLWPRLPHGCVRHKAE